ncbi:adenylate kinase [Candidatus Bathyarchaeota archaeon]|nr:adenylate kinase [Candidatus Bathyarchaeota archaeon]
MKIVILGPPGSGKGTYASRLKDLLGIPHISTGDMVREEIRAQTELGKIMKAYSERGELVPDEIIIDMLAKRLSKSDAQRGFILDGFPRTLKQAEYLEKISGVDLVINLNVPDEIIIQRLSNRLICKRCGAIYNRLTLKPKVDGICDKCGGELYQREDDRPEVSQERLNVYRRDTKPLIEYYRRKGILRDVYCESLTTTPEEMVGKIMDIIHREFKSSEAADKLA